MDDKTKEKIINIEVYTDGSLKKIGNVTFGGWAFVVIKDHQILFMNSGCKNNTTNQRMELQAIVEALNYIQTIRRNCEKVIIYSDSAYIINCYLQNWYFKWRVNGWVNSKGDDVANKDLWLQIIPFFDNFWYDFRKVKGHSGNIWNEKCDLLAQTQSQNLKNNWRGKDEI